MRIKKYIQYTIDLFGSLIYSNNYNELCLKLLKQKFEKKCYASSLIISIDKIVRISEVRFPTNRIDGAGYIDVIFEADTIIYEPGDIICCKVTKGTKEIYAEHKYIDLKVKRDVKSNLLKIIKDNQIIPFKIQRCKYIIDSKKISAIAKPLIPEQEPINYYYQISEKISEKEELKLSKLMFMINQQEKINELEKKKDPKIYNYFENLIYGYKKPQKFELSMICRKNKFKSMDLNMDNIKKVSNSIIVQPNEIHINEKRFLLTSGLLGKYSSELMVISEKTYTAFYSILNKYYKYLIYMEELVTNYNTLDKLKENALYWNAYNNL
jgi:DNA-directed RNA polymerase subunit E'/Rpb7